MFVLMGSWSAGNKTMKNVKSLTFVLIVFKMLKNTCAENRHGLTDAYLFYVIYILMECNVTFML